MYWIGLRPGDVHLNISSPGWAKHAWSNVFAPWLAGATVLVYNYARFDAAALMRVMAEHRVSTFCAPPTVWRMLIQADLTLLRTPPREVVGAGEPLNPEVIEQVRRAWGVTIRDGFGQTEMTLAVGNSPGQPVRAGSMGRPMPGYRVALLDPATGEPADEGEISFDLARRHGRRCSPATTANRHGPHAPPAAATTTPATSAPGTPTATSPTSAATTTCSRPRTTGSRRSRWNRCCWRARRSPRPPWCRRRTRSGWRCPKAYVVLAEGYHPNKVAARLIFEHSRDRLAPYQRIRRLEFAAAAQDDLRQDPPGGAARAGGTVARATAPARRTDGGVEYRIEDFPELR